MKKITLMQRLRYEFDNTMSRGTVSLIGWLAIVTLLLVIVVSLFLTIVGAVPTGSEGGQPGFGDTIWLSLKHAFNTGTVWGDTGTFPFMLAMFVVSFGGIFILSTLIGLLSTGMKAQLEDLRKGRSFVVEQNHTVILGWSNQIFSILSELAIANAGQKNACVVILADRDKLTMEDEIREKVGRTGKMRIVCRTGNPIDLGDLNIVNLHSSRSVIVLTPDGDDPDSQVIKSVLAITRNKKRREAPYNIVAEIRDTKNMEAAKLVGGGETQLIDVGDTVSRLIAQTCRQSGLSTVYTELLNFEGNEIYIHKEPGLTGKTYGEALLAYETTTVIGLRRKDSNVSLNAPMDTVIADGDALVVIARDDNSVQLSDGGKGQVIEGQIQPVPVSKHEPERTLILGWNWQAPTIINQIDSYTAAGSEVTVVADNPAAEAIIAKKNANLRHQKVSFQVGDITDRNVLDSLDIPGYQHVVVLSYSDTLDEQRADAHTLVTLLHLRDIRANSNSSNKFSIVSEMLDIRNKELAEVTRADDFIVSDKIISLLLAQISEDRYLRPVFADLFDPATSEIYLKPAADYVCVGQEVNLYTVVESARRSGQTAIGYKKQSREKDADKLYGIVLNPNKAQGLSFSEEDRIIVISRQ